MLFLRRIFLAKNLTQDYNKPTYFIFIFFIDLYTHLLFSLLFQVSQADWFHFLWDRFRGIRKDITQQALCCAGRSLITINILGD